MNLEQTLNGGYAGLYGEVVTSDMYHMKDVADIVSINDPTYVHVKGHPRGFDFIPNVIFDLGANIGIFSRYARELFPEALIVAVEPDPANCAIFKQFTSDPKIILIEKAIGKGKMVRAGQAANGAMEVYLSLGLGYSAADLKKYESTAIESIMLPDLKQYVKEGDKVLCKLDIEGNETVIFNNKASMDFLKTFDYIAIELHYYASDNKKRSKVRSLTKQVLKELGKTHKTSTDHNVYFYATKKNAHKVQKPAR